MKTFCFTYLQWYICELRKAKRERKRDRKLAENRKKPYTPKQVYTILLWLNSQQEVTAAGMCDVYKRDWMMVVGCSLTSG